jgi:RNA polymerase-binding transcription factor
MSRGFRNADATQDLSEKATADTINEILEADREQAAHSAELRAKGAYGLCERCGKEIGAERLEALPSATRCISCQAEWEQANRL